LNEALTQLGVGGIFAVLVIRMVLDFLSKRKESNGGGANKTAQEIAALRIVILGMEGQGGLVAEIQKLHERVHKQESENRGLCMKCERLESLIKQTRRSSEGNDQR
jgi:hypothetical protein